MTVFANALEVSCKAQANKIIAAFPDVCMTPPEAPPTPPGVPIPYPNFGMDSDTDKGTGTVKIGGKTVNQKNSSYFTKTTGDEAGAAAKKGVVSSKNTGKSYSQAFSMNVKAEGKNLTRFSDISTNNHGSPPNVPPWPKIGQPWVPPPGDPCAGEKAKIQKACKSEEDVAASCKKAGLDKSPGKRETDGFTHSGPSDRSSAPKPSKSPRVAAGKVRTNEELIAMADKAQKDGCLAALACKLPEYGDGNTCPCPGQTGHHVVPASSFFNKGRGENPKPGELPLVIHTPPEKPPAGYKKPPPYDPKKAPVVCAEGCSNTTGSHGMMHTEMKAATMARGHSIENVPLQVQGQSKPQKKTSMTYGEQKKEAIKAMEKTFPLSKCDPACIEAQLDDYHVNTLGAKDETPLRADKCGRSSKEIPDAVKMGKVRAAKLRASGGGG